MRALEELQEAVDAFCRFIEGLPAAAVAEKAWGPKEVLAHLLFWQESYVAQAEARLARAPFEPPRGSFEELNARVVEASRGVPVEEMLRRYRAVNERLTALAQSLDPASTMLVLKKGTTPRPLTWFITAEAGHIRDHQRTLLRQARRDPSGEADRLREAVDGLCRFIDGLPEAELAGQAWGPREVLAHLVFWHERYVAQIEAIVAGEPFSGPRGRQDELNARAVQASRGVPVEELRRRFQAADERLRGFARTLDPQDVVLEVQWKNGSWSCTLDDAIARVEAHIRSHWRELGRGTKRECLGS